MVALAVEDEDGILGHDDAICEARFPVIAGIPRLVEGDARWQVAHRHPEWFADAHRRSTFPEWISVSTTNRPDLEVVARFDREWHEFDRMAASERSQVFDMYFDLLPPSFLRTGPLVLDAGCGSGRWSSEMRRRGANVVAMDLGSSIELAKETTAAVGGIMAVQADVRIAPFRAGVFDLVTVLGVLHHIPETNDALRALVRTLRPNGRLILYVYYALDQRPWWYRGLYRVSDVVRRAVSRLPYRATRSASFVAAAVVYWPLSRLARLLAVIGSERAADALPLSSYRNRSFRTMRNDSLDRFGTRLEKRYTREEVVSMMTEAGLSDITVSSSVPYWHAVGFNAKRAAGSFPLVDE